MHQSYTNEFQQIHWSLECLLNFISIHSIQFQEDRKRRRRRCRFGEEEINAQVHSRLADSLHWLPNRQIHNKTKDETQKKKDTSQNTRFIGVSKVNDIFIKISFRYLLFSTTDLHFVLVTNNWDTLKYKVKR